MRARNILATFAACLAASFASAQTFPNKPITVVVPFAPGGNTDVIGRIITEHMGVTLGQKLVIENVAGAGGTTGALRVARAKNDGYTILVGQVGTHGASVGLFPNLAYNPVEDFEHVSQLSDTPVGLLARKDFPAKDFKEFVALVKADPNKWTSGHGGVGATGHASCVLFSTLIGAQSPMVAYPGSGPTLNDLLGGHFDYMCDQIPHLVQHVKAGNLKAYALAMPERSPALPDVPTSIEVGLPAFQASGWNALFAPKGTPPELVKILNAAANKAFEDPAIRKRYDDMGALIPRAAARTPEGLKAFVAAEIEKWTPIVRGAAIKTQ
jgi:tripartite-type tricarboxylate transporter receptor subunit TctC